ncbi:MAG: ABC transporter substrate-binding protein [Spirochaetaceae bacterium]|jgi:iron complex transport system substrate-binding protein|nr:ABC transporter substrate-binding protein [Spirochaetaceae bacterium]
MKKISAAPRLLSGVLCLALSLSACGIRPAEGSGPVRTVTDPMGNTVLLSRPIGRIISAAPSNTEIIVDLGAGDRLAAVDKYSMNIPGVDRSLPAIDFLYPDGEAIVALKPDLIIASEHNQAAGDDPFRLLREMGIAVAYIPTSGSIEEIYRDIAFIADLLEAPEKGEELIAVMKEAVEGIARTGSGIQEKKTVYFEISPPPYIVSFGRGTFLHEMLEIIGAENIFAGAAGWIAPGAEAVAAANPGVILTNTVLPTGENPVDELLRRPGFGGIRAIQNKAVYRIDTDSSSRPTHHIVRALREMARSVYPDYYE